MKRALRDLSVILRAGSNGPYAPFAAILEARGALPTPDHWRTPTLPKLTSPVYREQLRAP